MKNKILKYILKYAETLLSRNRLKHFSKYRIINLTLLEDFGHKTVPVKPRSDYDHQLSKNIERP